MLLQNPQLGYALLQAQVIMKIVDPGIAKVIILTTYLYTCLNYYGLLKCNETSCMLKIILITD